MRKNRVGGQAVIEGVMMRSLDRYVVAVRKPDGTIELKVEPYISISKRNQGLGAPVIRGIAGFFETLLIGIKSLNWSAEVSSPSEKNNKASNLVNTTLALFVALVLFLFIPLGLSNAAGLKPYPFLFNLFTGFIRVAIFLLYLYLISKIPDIKRFFQYHGAEHKSIFAYEAGKSLTLENVRAESPYHPRCGTSFLFITVLFAIIFFAVVDGAYAKLTGAPPALFVRIGLHFLLLPVMIGFTWEILRLSGELYERVKWARIFILPGLALQHITALEPTDDQIEIAIFALKNAVGEEDA